MKFLKSNTFWRDESEAVFWVRLALVFLSHHVIQTYKNITPSHLIPTFLNPSLLVSYV